MSNRFHIGDIVRISNVGHNYDDCTAIILRVESISCELEVTSIAFHHHKCYRTYSNLTPEWDIDRLNEANNHNSPAAERISIPRESIIDDLMDLLRQDYGYTRL